VTWQGEQFYFFHMISLAARTPRDFSRCFVPVSSHHLPLHFKGVHSA
jgi:hypothetical protein